MKKLFTILFVLSLFSLSAQTTSTFEDIPLGSAGFYNGSDFKSGFMSGDAFFKNYYDTTFGPYWEGFSVSRVNNDSVGGHDNQYASITGKANSGNNYAVFYSTGKIILKGANKGNVMNGFYITNSTYTYYDMKEGSAFSKKFGGTTGKDPDYLRVVIRAWKPGGIMADSIVKFYLADFRSPDSTKDYILNTWKYVSLKPFGAADSFSFTMESSDTGAWGMNTPAYFCMDDFNVIPTGISDKGNITYPEVYPNPVRDVIHVQGSTENLLLSLYNLQGELTRQTIGSALHVEDLPTGIYLLRIEGDGSLEFKRIVKE